MATCGQRRTTRVSVLQGKFHLSNGQLTLVLLIAAATAGIAVSSALLPRLAR